MFTLKTHPLPVYRWGIHLQKGTSMKKITLKNFIKHCLLTSQTFMIIERHDNEKNIILANNINVIQILNEKNLLKRVVSCWLAESYEIRKPIKVWVYPKGITTLKELYDLEKKELQTKENKKQH